MFTREDYFKNLGFKCDPFASTNAEFEEFLYDYFIDPPYFSSLIGSLDRPKTSIVIAPRGFGKTAQRKMLENLAANNNGELICIVYDNFPIEGVSDVKKVTFQDHLKRIIKSLLVAFLSQLYMNEDVIKFEEYERKILLHLIQKNLCKITTSEITQAINSIKGVRGKLFDIWLVAAKPITSIINHILKKHSLGSVDLSLDINQDENYLTDIEIINFIEKLFEKMGTKAIFILVDKVDENSLTGNDSNASYKLIKPLIRDLTLLERRRIVFKFFIWDKLTEHWSDDIRLDRIENFSLSWRKQQIRDMINKRLSVLSDYRINSLSQILDCDESILNSIMLFSNNSPRDMINILKCIFDIQINRANDISSIPSKQEIMEGIDKFCENKFHEIVTDKTQKANLKRLKLATFTISLLSNDIFKVNENSIRNIIMPWTRSGIVITLANKVRLQKNKRPVNLYTFNDIRIARYVCENQKLEDFIKRNIVPCNECDKINVFDKYNRYGLVEFICPKCQNVINLTNTASNSRVPAGGAR